MTVSATNATAQQLVDKVLADTGLVGIDSERLIMIAAEEQELPKDPKEVGDLSAILMRSALKRPITLTMMRTPTPFVIQMLEGMCGLRFKVPDRYRSMFYVSQPQVSVNAQEQPLEGRP